MTVRIRGRLLSATALGRAWSVGAGARGVRARSGQPRARRRGALGLLQGQRGAAAVRLAPAPGRRGPAALHLGLPREPRRAAGLYGAVHLHGAFAQSLGSLGPALLPALAALLVAWVVLRRRLGGGLPRGVVVYSDAEGRGRPLTSPARPLRGKPDQVIRLRSGGLVPVEYKSYRRGSRPPHGDLVQLGAYLVLLEDLHGRAPRYGVLRYADRVQRVRYTAALRREVLRLLEEVRANGRRAPEGRPSRALCRRCPFAPICGDAAR